MRRSIRTVLALAMLGAAHVVAAGAIESSTKCAVNRKGNEGAEARCFSVATPAGERRFQLYVPRTQLKDAALILVLHGGGGTGRNMEWLSERGFNRIADRDGVLIAYPDGIGKGWNDGRSDMRSQAVKDDVDDVAFLKQLVRDLAAIYPIDRSRVYATGISNGGMMSYRLACDAADTFAAVAPVAANLSVELAPRCHPSRPIAIAIFDGTDDPIMPWKGGRVSVLWTKRGEVISAPTTFERWIAIDQCATPRVTSWPDKNTNDRTRIDLHVAANCERGSEVRLYEIVGGGHTWPRGTPYLGPRIVGRVSDEVDANEEIWSFFQRFRSSSR